MRFSKSQRKKVEFESHQPPALVANSYNCWDLKNEIPNNIILKITITKTELYIRIKLQLQLPPKI